MGHLGRTHGKGRQCPHLVHLYHAGFLRRVDSQIRMTARTQQLTLLAVAASHQVAIAPVLPANGVLASVPGPRPLPGCCCAIAGKTGAMATWWLAATASSVSCCVRAVIRICESTRRRNPAW